MENYFQAFSIGSATGDIDDLGVAIGMYRQACYFRGFLEKNTTNGKWILSVEEVQCRFFDEFSFNDNFKWDKPLSWRSQDLGCWVNDIENPENPTIVKLPGSSRICLQNSDFQKLKEALSKKIPNSCIDYFIYSNFKSFSDEFIQKNITIL